MVARHAPAIRCSLATRLLLAASVAIGCCVLAYVVDVSEMLDSGLEATNLSSKHKSKVVTAVLDTTYTDALLNMTMRLRTIEYAILRMQQQQKQQQQQQQQQQDVHAQKSTAATQSSGAGKNDMDSDSDSNDEGFDTEKEEKEQRQLILYDEEKKTYRRWRPDYRCGKLVLPLPDSEPVECDPAGDAPCCSSLGWCGITAAHCNCVGCFDYRTKS